MSEESKEVHNCDFCDVSGNERPLLKAEYQGKDILVCVRCLPRLIHGG